jgi:predicted dehydrogenase
MIRAVLVGAGNRGLRTYGRYAELYPYKIGFVAVAEPDPDRRRRFGEIHGIGPESQYASWEEMLAEPQLCEAAFICTQDRMHFRPTAAALEKGYHVLLEKPMSQDPVECIRMAQLAAQKDRLLVIGHVLRFTAFFSAIKSIVDSGRIGDVVSVQHSENIGYWHFAHSFVRGNWRKAADSSPMILTKCCHDMDILLWLLGGRSCVSLSSFGTLRHFRPENAPAGSTERCTDGCAAEGDCPYSALKLYLGTPGGPWYARGLHPVTMETLGRLKAIVSHDTDNREVLKALKSGPYGRCVFRCDNDVADNQVVNLEFRDGVTAVLSACGFTAEWMRTVKVMGTRGEIRGHQGKDEIQVQDFSSGSQEVLRLPRGEGHGGGDEGLISDFIERVSSPAGEESRTAASVSVHGHLMAMAAEKARLERKVIDMEEYYRQVERSAAEGKRR